MSRARAYDREIVAIALPALGALTAEPLYLLADTAIVGHLGTAQLAALALAATALGAVTTMFNFLVYGTTSAVARAHGGGEHDRAHELGGQAVWLGLAIGCLLAIATVALAGPATSLLGGHGHVAALAARYLRISAPGLPAVLLATAGQGYLRGVSQLRRPLVIVIAANAANLVLELALVYGARLGLDGSALGTVIAQLGMGIAFAAAVWPLPRPQLRLMSGLARVGAEILVRTASLYASFVVASAVLARIGKASLGAHQVAFQLFNLIALVLDALAIAGQVMVARMLGAGDGEGAYAVGRRLTVLSVAGGIGVGALLGALYGPLPHVFTTDPAVIGRLHAIWPLLALMQPIGAAVFAFDGILIGAGDTLYLAIAMFAASVFIYVPVALLALELHWGIVGVWSGLVGLIAVRCATTGVRFVRRRWIVLGSTHPVRGAPRKGRAA
ncbi:MAG TPA: MATE family efflux transporter [Solirubrobacteraceae bacterium]|nr:MATE family efflux transporter [Solirubrobacteraceae bacterium]